MTDELKPVRCGCGGKAMLYVSPITTRWLLQCESCKIETTFYDTEAEAITAWNRAMGDAYNLKATERTAKVEVVEKPNVFKCAECGQYMHSTAWGSPVLYCSRCGCRLEWE